MTLSKLVASYNKVYGFLSKTFMKSQDDYAKDLSHFYKVITNHTDAFDVAPQGNLLLYSDEWKNPSQVYETLEDASANLDNSYICDWIDDYNNKYYTYIYTDEDDAEVKCVTRTHMMKHLSEVAPTVIDSKWHAVRLLTKDGCYYVWESYPMEIYELMDIYTSWVKRYGEWIHDEESSDSDENEDTGEEADDEEADEDSADDEKSSSDESESDCSVNEEKKKKKIIIE
jgi:hypothetical protein